LSESEIDELLKKYKKKRSKPYMLAKREYDVEEFKRIVKDYREEQAKINEMEPDERQKYL
jgi:hypothetical protein